MPLRLSNESGMATKVKNTRKPAPKGKARSNTKATVKAKSGNSARKPAPKRAQQNRTSTISDQQRLDAIGLALMAASVFFAFVFYFGWQGGKLGDGLQSLFTSLIGQAAYLVPLALAAAGIVAILRSVMPEASFRWPAVAMLSAGVLLALAAGLFGLGADKPVHHVIFNAAYYKGHGGIFGEMEFWAVAKLTGTIGADIVALALITIGAIQLTGVPLVVMGEWIVSIPENLRTPRRDPRIQTAAVALRVLYSCRFRVLKKRLSCRNTLALSRSCALRMSKRHRLMRCLLSTNRSWSRSQTRSSWTKRSSWSSRILVQSRSSCRKPKSPRSSHSESFNRSTTSASPIRRHQLQEEARSEAAATFKREAQGR